MDPRRAETTSYTDETEKSVNNAQEKAQDDTDTSSDIKEEERPREYEPGLEPNTGRVDLSGGRDKEAPDQGEKKVKNLDSEIDQTDDGSSDGMHEEKRPLEKESRRNLVGLSERINETNDQWGSKTEDYSSSESEEDESFELIEFEFVITDDDHASLVAREEERKTGKTWTGDWAKWYIKVTNSFVLVDTAELQEVIQSGNEERVRSVLGKMSDVQVKTQLRAEYGGTLQSPNAPDDKGLYGRTNPILHAARRGNHKTVETIFEFIDKLRLPTKKILTMADAIGRPLLAMAASSGDEGTYKLVLEKVEKEFGESQVNTMMGKIGGLMLTSAVRSGELSVMNLVHETLRYHVLPKVPEMMYATDENGRSLLAISAASGCKAAFDFVLDNLIQDCERSSTLQSQERFRKVKKLMTSRDKNGLPLLAAAIESGCKETFSSVLDALLKHLTPGKTIEAMRGNVGTAGLLLTMAAEKGIFKTVFDALRVATSPDDLTVMLKGTPVGKRSLLALAVESGSKADFEGVRAHLATLLKDEEIYELIEPKTFLDDDLLWNALKIDAAVSDDDNLGLFKAAIRTVEDCLYNEEVEGMLQAKRLTGHELLCSVFQYFESQLFQKTPEYVGKTLADKEAAGELTNIFIHLVKSNDSRDGYGHVNKDILDKIVDETSKSLMTGFLENLASRGKLLEWVKICLAGPLVSAKNPFVDGMTLSVAFARAAAKAPEGERRNLLALHSSCDKFLLEVLERLPNTVRGFERRMSDCFALLLEKRTEDNHSESPEQQTPLYLMINKREQRQVFCTAPLIMDFLSRRFWRGLPDVWDSGDILDDMQELKYLAEVDRGNGGLIINRKECGDKDQYQESHCHSVLLGKDNFFRHLTDRVTFLQGADAGLPGLAGIPLIGGLPGLQFILAGVVAMPSSYYRVPAMRMIMDFVVYLVMVVAFCIWVLLHHDGALTVEEVVFFVAFVVAGIYGEAREMMRDMEAYRGDQWNVLDVLGLVVMLAAFIARCDDSDSQLGRALYAASAPLVFSRLLFFAQILRFQGPMIQVIFSTTEELLKFGVIMLVVMFGFVMAFYALFLDVDGFGDTWLNLFKAMLGEVGLFDEFEEGTRDRMATALLVLYLLVITIMLLNLLVAVLSTAHAKVEANAEKEFKISQMRIFRDYEMVVDNNFLPAPFNLVKLPFSLLFAFLGWGLSIKEDSLKRYDRSGKEAFGQFVFWLVMSTVAVAVGSFMWIISAFYAPFAWWKYYWCQPMNEPNTWKEKLLFSGLRCFFIFLWCLLGFPLWLIRLWLTVPLRWILRVVVPCRDRTDSPSQPNHPVNVQVVVHGRDRTDSPSQPNHPVNVQDLLKKAPGGVGARDLFSYLQDPLNDPDVRKDDIDQRATVRHVKLLRDRLETTTKMEICKLNDICKRLAEQQDRIEKRLNMIFAEIKPHAVD